MGPISLESRESIKQLLVNSYKFEKWLESKQDDEVVGKSKTSHSCPLANFIHESVETEAPVLVGFSHLADSEDRFLLYLPRWATEFIWRVDNDLEKTEITKQDALRYFVMRSV